jgi:hypothetical protein
MKLTTKKILAREFLTLTLVITLGLISFLCTYPYNAIKRNQIENKSIKISEQTKLADSLSFSYKSKHNKQNWFFEKLSNQYDLSDDTTFDERDEIWKRFNSWTLKDSINYKWEYIWSGEITTFFKSIGVQNSNSLQSFIENNTITKTDSSNFNTSLAINAEIAMLSKSKKENKGKIFLYNEQKEFGLKAIYICFIVFFGIRYLFYSIKWSLKTLKQKSE